MKPKILTVAAIALVLVGCGKNPLDSQWVDKKMTIDGDADDWANTPAQIIEENNSSLRILNDERNLYLLFQFNDMELARKVFRGGVKLWFDKDHRRGIFYRGSFAVAESLKVLADRDNRESETRPRPGPDMVMPGMIRQITIDGKRSYNESDPDGPNAGSTYHNGVFCFEFAIPLLDWDGLPFVEDIEKEGFATIGIEVGGLNPEKREMMRGNRGGGMRGEGRGRGGGMMGGRGGDRRPEGMSRRNRPEGEEFWLTVRLANKEQE